MHKRWYDVDPTISLSISLLRNASDSAKLRCAEFIIDYTKDRGVTLKTSTLNDAFNYIMKRWYDKDKTIAEAFEYFENAPLSIQKEVAIQVINLLHVAETL